MRKKARFIKQLQCLWSQCQTAPSQLYQQSLCSVTAIMITINFGCCPKRRSRCSKQRIRTFHCWTQMSEPLSVHPCKWFLCLLHLWSLEFLLLSISLIVTHTYTSCTISFHYNLFIAFCISDTVKYSYEKHCETLTSCVLTGTSTLCWPQVTSSQIIEIIKSYHYIICCSL